MQKQQGFSLIELLVVIGIIGALTAIAIPQYQKYQDKAKVTAAIATLTNMRSVVEAHIMEKGEFPEKAKDVEDEELGIPEGITLAKTKEVAGTMTIAVKGFPGGNNDQKVVLERKESGAWTCTQPLEEEVSNCAGSGKDSDTNNG